MSSILIVSGQFYEDLAGALLQGAVQEIMNANLSCDTVGVPGALEIPQAIRYGISSGKYAGYVALGTVIRGETGHYDIVAVQSSRALMDLSLQHQVPIGNGILTVENFEQAWERADPERRNKGGEAARAVIELLSLKRRFSKGTKV